jgi:hypothetical protein
MPIVRPMEGTLVQQVLKLTLLFPILGKVLPREFPSVWTNIHTYCRFKATRRGLRAFGNPGRTLTPHNLSERLNNALRAYFFGGFLSFPTWDMNKYSTPRPVVKEKKLDVCLYKITRSDTGFIDLSPLKPVLVEGVWDRVRSRLVPLSA